MPGGREDYVAPQLKAESDSTTHTSKNQMSVKMKKQQASGGRLTGTARKTRRGCQRGVRLARVVGMAFPTTLSQICLSDCHGS